jgi:hypothetical protein
MKHVVFNFGTYLKYAKKINFPKIGGFRHIGDRWYNVSKRKRKRVMRRTRSNLEPYSPRKFLKELETRGLEM